MDAAVFTAPLTARTRGRGRFGFVQLLLDFFDVRGVHPATHLAQRPPGLLGPQRATLEVDADDAHASSVAGFRQVCLGQAFRAR